MTTSDREIEKVVEELPDYIQDLVRVSRGDHVAFTREEAEKDLIDLVRAALTAQREAGKIDGQIEYILGDINNDALKQASEQGRAQGLQEAAAALSGERGTPSGMISVEYAVELVQSLTDKTI